MVLELELAQVLGLGSEVLELVQVLAHVARSEVRVAQALAHVVRNEEREEREVSGVVLGMFQRSRMLVQYRLCTCLHGRYHSRWS